MKTLRNTFKHIQMTVLALVAALTLGGCESMDDINTDPTRMSQATPGSFLNPTLYGMGCYTWQRFNGWTFPIMQEIVSTSSTAGVGWYHISDDAGSGTWSTYYQWLNNAKAIYNYGVKTGTRNYQAIGLTLQAWITEGLVEAFGDVPVDEACLGDSGVYYPKFNTQKEAFTTILADLAKADTLFNTKEGLKYNSSGDMMYCQSSTDADGIAKWRKFANSLRLRCLLRVLNVDGLNAKEQIQAMFANPGKYPLIDSNDASAAVSITGIAPEEQPMPRISDLTSYLVYSSFFIDRLKQWNDPRLAIWASKVTLADGTKDYKGIQSGYSVLTDPDASQPIAVNIAQAPMKLMILPYAEVEFMKAELIQRGIIQGDAKKEYEAGVKASAEQWGATLPDDYFDNAEAAYDGTLKRIMEQKFYALFFVGMEQWFEYNRTGYPEVPVGPGVDAGDAMPRRFKYPTVLQRTNPNNYKQAVEDMGGNRLDIKLIWQK